MRTNMKTNQVAVGLLSLFLMSCGQKAVNENLSAKVNNEPSVAGAGELQKDASKLIQSTRLTSMQRNQLENLQIDSRQQLQAFNEESLKLRSILIKDVFALDYNKAEVKFIQNRIKNIELKRVALIFETIDKANGIFGRETDAEEKERNFNLMIIERQSI